SLELAEKLFAKYESRIRDNMGKDIDGWGEPYTEYQKSIYHFLEKIPNDILERFQGHGIIRKSTFDQLAGALNILANKSIKGECGRLGGEIYGYGAYKGGDFLVISKIDKGLPITEERDGRQQSVFNEIGWIADIGAFVIDTEYYPMVEELKRIFPDVNIIKANELTEYLKSEEIID
ncbi:MAG: hypothetical protein ABIG60_06035, partial [Patescibacteria group bacterium]